MNIKSLLITATISIGMMASVQAQEVLKKADAVSIALENNFDIRAANNNLEIAENNAHILNSGFLPTVTGSAGANQARTSSDFVFSNGDETSINAAKSSGQNASANLNYTLFDGMGRRYNFSKLQETYRLSEIQARAVMENTMVNLFFSYYEIARLSENVLNQKETLDISRERLLRTRYSFEFGQTNQLDILNAEVDYNKDSINYLTIVQLLSNEKRNLNLLMGRAVEIEFAVDTTLVFEEALTYSALEQQAKSLNSGLLIQQANVRNSQYDIRIASSTIIPKIGLNSSYGWNNNAFAPGNFLSERSATSLSLGASLTWNIFDGGSSNIRRQNSKLQGENQQILLEQTALDLDRQLSNSWTLYQTALFVMKAEKKNQDTNRTNFDRSKEQYELGLITSIEFRQAQFNLLSANLSYNAAKYTAKIAELKLMQLSGIILEAKF